MRLGVIGLGRMGAKMVRPLRAGHGCVVYDVHPDTVAALAREGATGSASRADFVAKLRRPRAVWLMVPAAIVDRKVDQRRASGALMRRQGCRAIAGKKPSRVDTRRCLAHAAI